MVRCGHIIAVCFVQLLQLAVGLTVATAMSFCVCAVCVTHLRVCVLSDNIYLLSSDESEYLSSVYCDRH